MQKNINEVKTLKSVNEMNNRDLLGLLKVYSVISFTLRKYNQSDNFGFSINIKSLFTESVYNTIVSVGREKTTNYQEYGFKFIEYLFDIKNYEHELFIKDLEQKVRFIESLKKEINQLSKFKKYHYDFEEYLKVLNQKSDRHFYFITCYTTGQSLYIEFEFKNVKNNEYILNNLSNEYELCYKNTSRRIINQELCNNFLNKYEYIEEEYEYTKIF